MDVSGSTSASQAQIGRAVQVALQKQMLDQMQVQGAGVVNMLATAPTAAASVNSPTQGHFVDALA